MMESEPGLTVVDVSFRLLAVQRQDVTNTQELTHRYSRQLILLMVRSSQQPGRDVIPHVM